MHPLTETEKIALAHVEMERNRAVGMILKDVEARLRLPPGSLGKTHGIDMESGCVVERPREFHADRAAVPSQNGTPEPVGERRDVDPGTP